ncbi:MAG: transpeptidase family protein [Treponema sp.]|jgi:cell division protein FtsI (penicillin-binding protein 3)|nr:transpeptidase family protein [Treponema sp.]
MNSRKKGRFLVFVSLFSLAALAVLVRYGSLMTGEGRPPLRPRSRGLAGRGSILDRNGRILALQTRLANISVWRPELDDIEELARELEPVLEISQDEIVSRVRESSGDFIYLKKQVDESAVKLVEKAQAEGRLRGVGIEPVVGRVYPERSLAAQIVGFTGDGNNGLAGIEYAFEDDLVSPDGGQGGQVVLTLDANVQYILERTGRGILEETGAEAVIFMAADPRTGDILGSASLPGFDPNDFRSSSDSTRMDRPAIWAYEPGSVFKIFSLSALLDSGAIGEDTVFFCDGHYERTTSRGETIIINCLGAHGRVTARDIIVHSCNAGAAYASDRLSGNSFYELLRNYGFGTRTGAGNPGETAGFLRPVERWSERSKPTIAMGQEIAVSALQMIQAAAAVANDGILVPPRIVSRVVSADGKNIRTIEAGTPRRVLKSETARAMRGYMVDVTSSIGTGWRASVEDLSLAVKTGTAQIIDPRTGAYSETDFISSCIALLPAESPSLVLYLVIVKPRGEYLGGRIAAPPIRQAAEELADYLGIPRGRNLQVSHPGMVDISPETLPPVNGTTPDLMGLSKRALLPLLLRDDFNLEIRGNGWVRRQDPPPGTPLESGAVIVVELE